MNPHPPPITHKTKPMEQKVERKPLLSDGARHRYSKREAGSNRPGMVKFYRIDGPGRVELYVTHEHDVDNRVKELNDALDAGFGQASRRIEGMIDRGELVIPKTGDITCVEYGVDASTGLVEHVSVHYCRECHLRFECRGLLPARLCPGCGARIIDAVEN